MTEAEQSFEHARRQAFLERVVGQLRGRTTSLLPFDQVKEKLGLQPASDRGLQEIPLDNIVGSVGRYREFTRSFLPRDDSIRERWKRIYRAAQGLRGLPPIELYQVGDVYFVKDGNHRVSVAHELEAKTIQAYVREFVSPVPLSTDTDLDDLILKAENARFLQHTQLDELRPEAQLEVTSPGYYEKLEEHIAVHGYFLGLDEQRDVSWEEAVSHWYDAIYMPMVNIIREHDILEDFAQRTETDLYLWIMEHRHHLVKQLGQEIDLTDAARHFAEEYSPRIERVLERAQQTATRVLTPDQLEAAPPPGQWREGRVQPRSDGRLLADILVVLDGSPSSWCAVEQAISMAQRESARVYCLYLAGPDTDKNIVDSLHHDLAQRCDEAGVSLDLIAEAGEPAHLISERSRWVDLLVLTKPGPSTEPSGRLSLSTFHAVMRRTSRPLLAVGRECRPLNKALLAYDASPTAEEALFVATHMGKQWGIALTVLTVEEAHRTSQQTLDSAIHHLQQQGVTADAVFRRGGVARSILRVAEKTGSDLLVMGGAGYSPFMRLFLRSTLDHVLRKAEFPVLICR
jgi:nucleotide-binding universal stress UspA family protein